MARAEPTESGGALDRCQAGVRRHPLAIVIAHYNDPKGLALSLASISDQEPADVIVIDDGSQRLPVSSDLRGHLNAAHHLDLITLQRNSGPAQARNEGLRVCLQRGYELIAIFDCGDVSHPDRFRLQRRYLIDHPEIALLGSAAEFYTESGQFIFSYRPATSDERIRRSMYYYNQFINSSIMFRAAALATTGLYPLGYRILEDYPFAFRFVRLLRTANLEQPLLRVIASAGGISTRRFRRQKVDALRTILDNFDPSYLFPFALGALKYAASWALGVTVHRWLLRIYEHAAHRPDRSVPGDRLTTAVGHRPGCHQPGGEPERAARNETNTPEG